MIEASASILSDFHHWLLDPQPDGAAFLAIAFATAHNPECAARISRQLNEFDAAATGAWMPVDADLILSIATEPTQRRLLGVADSDCPPTSPGGQRQILTALARRGHVVIDHPLATDTLRDHARGFHVAIGQPAEHAETYDLIIRPDAFRPQCLAPLIADSFLEWIEAFTDSAT